MSGFKQVIVVRNDLNMRKGKMVAQGAHASIMFLVLRLCVQEAGELDYFIEAWMNQGMTNICVRVDSEVEVLVIAQKS